MRKKILVNAILACQVVIAMVAFSFQPVFAASNSSNYSLSSFDFAAGVTTTNVMSSDNNILYYPILGQPLVGTLTSANYTARTGMTPIVSAVISEEAQYRIKSLTATTEIGGEIIFSEVWQNDNDPYFYWQADVTPITLIQGYSIGLDEEPDDEVDITMASYLFTEDSMSDGEHTFYVRTISAGGVAGEVSSFDLWVDTIEPSVDNYVPSTGETVNENEPLISCYLSDGSSGVDENSITMEVDDLSIDFTYEGGYLSYQTASILSEGDHAVLIIVSDIAENQKSNGWGFVVDTEGPQGDIVINGGDSYTESAEVRIQLTATDDTSEVTHVMISNYEDFRDAEWQLYEISILDQILLDPDIIGQRNVYVKFRDSVGNESEVYMDSIELRARLLETRIISGPATITDKRKAEFYFESTLADSKFSYRMDDLGWSEWLLEGEIKYENLSYGNHYFQVKAGKDLDGDGEISQVEEDLTPAFWIWTIAKIIPSEEEKHKILYWEKE